MTCESCGANRMDVNTWQIPNICKINTCVPCMRGIEKVIQAIHDKALEEAKSYVEEIINARKRIEEQKR